MSESQWEDAGDDYTLSWGGRAWTLKVNAAEPGLSCESELGTATVLALHGLAAAGRFESHLFAPETLVRVERYRNRVQATFAPPCWGGLTVRAAWGPSCAGLGVDLEVQAAATSVGQLHDVEVVVKSEWQRTGGLDLSASWDRLVQPRDARSAALSYDGRVARNDLCSLTTLPLVERPWPSAFRPRVFNADTSYLEMVQPDDVARQVWLRETEPKLAVVDTVAVQYGLFGHDFEKGVVFRARLRACWISADTDAAEVMALYRSFLDEPLPLGP